jgi:hypothetical protein
MSPSTPATPASSGNPASLLRSYLFWTYERGSIHYDVMVSLILLFLFVAPRFIDFGDKPVATVPLRSSEVLVKEDGSSGRRSRFIYQIRADQKNGFPNPGQTEDQRRAAILRVVEPISGEVTLDHYDPIRDARGAIVAYDVYILR